jgi:protein O-mannosyl-transferase
MNDQAFLEPGLPGGISRRFLVLVLAIVLFGASLILYAPSLGFGFIGYDEAAVLLGHPNLYGGDSLASSLREILVGYFPREEPLIVRDLTWLADSFLFGFGKPLGYHLGNVILNAVDVVLLFAFLLHATRRLAFAGLVAGLFCLLAIHVEPVCWAMGRKDLLAGFFTLLALLAQSMALREASVGRCRALHVLVFLL